MNKRIAITGSTGFLGRSFISGFSVPGYELVPIGGARSDGRGSAQKRVDLSSKENIRAVLREIQPTHVLNFASRGVTRDQSTLAELLAVNAIGATYLVEALMEEGLTPQTYFFGTAYEFADSRNPLGEMDRLDPKSPYAISKTTQYYALQQYAGAAPLTLLRLFNVFGAGEPSERLIPFIARKARDREPIPLTGGEQLRDFMHITDLVAILGQLITSSPQSGNFIRTLNIGTGKGISLREFIEKVAISLKLRGYDPDLRFGELPYRLQDPMCCIADNTALRLALGELTFTKLETAIDQTVGALDGH